MATLFRPLFRPQALGLGLGAILMTFHSMRQPAVRLDAFNSSESSYQRTAQTPMIKRGGGIDSKAVRQISAGSIIGLVSSLTVSKFSKTLAILLGLIVVGVQVAASYGINVTPYGRLQKYVKSIDLRSAVQDNVAFKLSFGSTFALAAFMQF
ncbi:hypothetical protein BJ878DRAFT_497381 [Calycina marina]|uniref:Fun14 family protein n=1 Tax=Calycina marina TaxID=1763456 RepID=A0A9P8CGM5_9HELO|nr:hypothetical protein BJ878DRAFT_497381 [Calycina marina]